MKTVTKILFSALILAAATTMAFGLDMRLDSLKCLDTEDSLGADECELRIFVDGTLKEKLRKDLNDGQSWSIGKTYSFATSFKMELWDLDSPDPNDILGTFVYEVKPDTLPGGGSRSLNGSGWKYTLNYTVSGTVTQTKQDRAIALIAGFRTSTKTGVFTTINKATLLSELEATVKKPTLINQPDQGLCGPNAILYLLADRNPERYVAMARGLYEDGKWSMQPGKVLQPGSHLYAAVVPAKYRSCDWMMGASMRDAENVIFDFDEGDQFAALTNFGEMAEWMKLILECKRVEIDRTFLSGETDAMQMAGRAVATGNVAVMCVDHGYLPGQTPSGLNYPTHWIVLLRLDHDVPLFSFLFWTWGRDMYDKNDYISNISEDRFEDLLWGVVVGYY